MNNQDKLIELIEDLLAGQWEHWAKKMKAHKVEAEINNLANQMFDAIDLKIGEAMPAEYLSFELLNNTSYEQISYLDAKKATFNMDYFLEKYEKTTGHEFYDAIRNDDRFDNIKKEEFIDYIEEHRGKDYNVYDAMSMVQDLTTYMSENNALHFTKALDEIEDTIDIETTKREVRDMLFSSDENPSRFEQIGKEIIGDKKFAEEFDTLRESKKGILGFGPKELNDMSFVSVMHEATLEKEKSLQEICQKIGISKMFKDHKIFDRVKFGDIRVGTRIYNLQDYADNDPKILRKQINSNYINEESLKELKNEKFLKQKESKQKAAAEAERIKQETEDRAVQNAKKEMDKRRIDNIISEAEKTKISRVDAIDVSPDLGNHGTKQKEELNKASANLLEAKKSYEAKSKDYKSFVLMDIDNPDVAKNIKQWGGKQTDAKTLNEMYEFIQSVKPLYPKAQDVYDLATEDYRARRQEKVADAIIKKTDDFLQSIDVHTKAIDDMLERRGLEDINFYEGALDAKMAKVKMVLDTNKVLYNNIKEDENLKKGVITKDNFYAVNIYLKSDVQKLENYIKETPTKEMKESIEILDYIQQKDVMGIKYTYDKVYETAKSRSDFKELEFKQINDVKKSIDLSTKPKEKTEISYGGRERTLFGDD